MKAQAAVLKYFPPPLKVTREQIVMLLEGTECDLTSVAREALMLVGGMKERRVFRRGGFGRLLSRRFRDAFARATRLRENIGQDDAGQKRGKRN